MYCKYLQVLLLTILCFKQFHIKFQFKIKISYNFINIKPV